MHLRHSLAALALLSSPAFAQSFNIDIGFAGSAPSSAFGGALEQPGTWNNVTAATAGTINLINLDGTPSTISFTHPLVGSYITNTNANLTGDFNKLLTDTQSYTSPLTYTVTGLPAGYYLVATYALDADSPTNTFGVTVAPANGLGTQSCGAIVPTGNSYAAGKTHALNCHFSFAGSLTITVAPGVGGTAQCAGIQIRRVVQPSEYHFRVKPGATGDGNGLSWANAFTNLQDALDVIHRIGSNFSVWVAAGTFKPTTGADRAATFKLYTHTGYYGGFIGNEESLEARAFPLGQTILSGNISNANIETDNSYVVADASNTDEYTRIDGFTFTKSYNNSGFPTGGGLLLNNSKAKVANCRFLFNHAGSGAGVGIIDGLPSLVNCYFYQNVAVSVGAALSMQGADDTVNLVNCQFLGNQSGSHGGALYAYDSNFKVTNSIFSGNQAGASSDGGAIYLFGDDITPRSCDVINCSFSHNYAPSGGGAVYLVNKCTANFMNSILWNDLAILNSTANEVGLHPGTNCLASFGLTTFKGSSGFNGLDPMFVDSLGLDGTSGTADDNLRLSPGSPCIDSANHFVLPVDTYDLDGDFNYAEQITRDLDNHPRQTDILGIADGAAAGSPALDRGAYELQMPPCLCDMNRDGISDLNDFFDFFNAFDQTKPLADIDLSGEVDLNDFFLFLSSFDVGCP